MVNFFVLIILGCFVNIIYDCIGFELMIFEDYMVVWYLVEFLLNVVLFFMIIFMLLIGFSWWDNILNNFENIDIWEIWLFWLWNYVICLIFECCVIVEFDYVVYL